MKFLSVDRIEKNHIICEDENQRVHMLDIKDISENLNEGDIIKITSDGDVIKDEEKTTIRRKEIVKLRRFLYFE